MTDEEKISRIDDLQKRIFLNIKTKGIIRYFLSTVIFINIKTNGINRHEYRCVITYSIETLEDLLATTRDKIALFKIN
jgi:hypothetical protein